MLAHLLLSTLAVSPQHTLDTLPIRLDPAREAQILPVSLDGSIQAMSFEQVVVLEDGVVPQVASAQGTRPADLGGLTMWRMTDGAGSRGFIGISKWGVAGFCQSDGQMHVISSGPWGQTRGAVTAVPADELPEPTVELPPCEVRTPPGWTPPVPRRGGGQDFPCRAATIAVETDWEFTERVFNGDPDIAAAYAVTLTGAISEIYINELNVRFGIGFLRTWADDSDPYDPDSSVDMLDQFRNHWTSQMTEVDRTIAHILTGRTNLPYGGVAWLGVLCNNNFGYGVSGYIEGSFPQPLQNNHGDNWDLLVMAHELGHNFGTLHTHDGFNPPLDNCGNGDCTGAENGTIMSYCHICPGGVSNIELGFRDEVRGVIIDYLEAISDNCSLDAGAAVAMDDNVWTLPNVGRDINVLANDAGATCDETEVAIDEFDAESVFGGTITLVPGSGGAFDQLHYVPAVDFIGVDTFTYALPDGQTATVTVEVISLREPDTHGDLEDGLAVGYYILSNPQSLPNYDEMDPYLNGVLAQVNLPSTDGAFAGSGRSDEVGARLTALIDVPQDGLYTFYTESDDGSGLWVGNLHVVENDGVHGMQERSGLIGLAQGRHRIRVDFFEQAAGAGLIVRWSGPGLAKQIIPAASWAHEVSEPTCPQDLDGSGMIDVNDLLAVISAFGPCDGCDEDFNGDGDVGVDEILSILALFGGPC